jgi:WhiB family redox-sensing transcriptional regulator
MIPPWLHLAECSGTDSELFFGPDQGETAPDRDQREAMAKAICAPCPVQAKCRKYAVDGNITYGVWGGLGEFERVSYRRKLMRRARRAAGTAIGAREAAA